MLLGSPTIQEVSACLPVGLWEAKDVVSNEGVPQTLLLTDSRITPETM